MRGTATRAEKVGTLYRFWPSPFLSGCRRVRRGGRFGGESLRGGIDSMTKVAVYHEPADPESMPYRAVAGRNQASGRTPGEGP